MALVKNIEEGGKFAKEHKIAVVCRYRIEREIGRVQLETHKEEDEHDTDSPKQIIQFNETSAKQLIEIFKEVFPKIHGK